MSAHAPTHTHVNFLFFLFFPHTMPQSDYWSFFGFFCFLHPLTISKKKMFEKVCHPSIQVCVKSGITPQYSHVIKLYMIQQLCTLF